MKLSPSNVSLLPILLLCILCLKFQVALGQNTTCWVTQASDGTLRPCVFPFIFKAKSYSVCTKENDPDGKIWCSTEVTPQGHHVGGKGHWGFCDPECQVIFENQARVRENTPSTTVQPDVIFTETVTERSTDSVVNDSLGTWEPNAEFAECGSPQLSGSFIVRGEDAKPAEFGFAVLLGGFNSDGEKRQLCGGSLINGWYVLTAAHCFSSQIKITEILVGEVDVSRENESPHPVQKFSPAKIISHPEFNIRASTQGFDIALIRLDRKALLVHDDILKSRVVPVCLPWTENEPGFSLQPETKVTVVGWGVTDKPRRQQQMNIKKYGVSEPVLQKVEISVVSKMQCQSKYPGLATERLVCALLENKDSCSGDSGGPLIVRESEFDPWFQAGIVAFGPTNCGSGSRPGVYSKVSYYIDWIRSQLEP